MFPLHRRSRRRKRIEVFNCFYLGNRDSFLEAGKRYHILTFTKNLKLVIQSIRHDFIQCRRQKDIPYGSDRRFNSGKHMHIVWVKK